VLSALRGPFASSFSKYWDSVGFDTGSPFLPELITLQISSSPIRSDDMACTIRRSLTVGSNAGRFPRRRGSPGSAVVV
jgi:hypothetical protein